MKRNNLLALLRFSILPIIIYLISKGEFLFSIGFLFITFILEFFDNKLKKGEVGSFLNPLSHKIFTIGILFVLFLRGEFHIILLLFFVLRDIIISIIKWIGARDDAIIRFDIFGKIMSYLLFGAIFSILFRSHFSLTTGSTFVSDKLAILFVLFSIAAALLSIIHHVLVYLKKLHRQRKKGRKIEKEDVIILANKRSRGYKHRYRRHLLKVFAKRRKASVIHLPPKKKMFEDLGNKIKENQQIIIAGGDGSFEGALNYKPFNDKLLGFFPMGAGNAFYSYFYKGKRFEYLRDRFPFHEMEMDVMELEWDQGKLQTTFFTIGVDSEVMKVVDQQRGDNGFLDAVIASVKVIVKIKPSYDVKCKIDGKEYFWKNLVNFNFGKIPYFGFGIRSLLGKIAPDDGNILGMACVNSHPKFLNKGLRLWGLVLVIFGLSPSPLLPVKGREIVIESEKLLPLQAGGEFLGYTHKLRAKVVRKQKVLVV